LARWLPTIAVVIAILALGLAAFRQPEAPPFDPTDLSAIQQDVNDAAAAADALTKRVDALERAATAAPAVDVETELSTVKGDVDDLASGLENACSAIRDLSSRISDLQDSIDRSSIQLLPSIGGRC
jgi:chromosome segregation ATPase